MPNNYPIFNNIEQVIDTWHRSPLAPCISSYRIFPATPARAKPFPDWLASSLSRGLRSRGIEGLYHHQWQCIQHTHAGRDVVVATPTASGKTLCYNLPVFHELLADPQARALYIFPTKALARDQVEEIRALAAACDTSLGAAVYDGDTPPDQRRAARRKARILLTNPEMLHAGILPHHPTWAELFSGLRYVVVDELHSYRGIFGSHLANLLRRLVRVARFHGSAPQFVATSATIANPAEHASRLFGRPATLVHESGAPQGVRHFLVVNPPVVDPSLGLRQSYLKMSCRLTRDLAAAKVSTLVFCRSRLAMEVLLRKLRDTLTSRDLPADRIETIVRGYRGGYLPGRRRDVERALRQGEAEVVVATSALELGIDIGALDAVVVAGWPGSRAATWQRAGRAGRRLAPSLTVLVTSSDPVDQYVAADPEYLFGQAPEHARIDAENPSILVPHLKCATFELPFPHGESYGDLSVEESGEVLGYLAESSLIHRSAWGFHYVGEAYPANDVNMRGPLVENFLVVEQPGGQIIAEVDHHDATQVLHEGAIYQLEGRQYQVEQLDHDNSKAFVTAVAVDYYTDAMTHTRVRVLEQSEADLVAAHGEVHVLHRVVGFKKIKLNTHENLGYGEISLPDRQMHTTAFWLSLPFNEVAQLGRSAAEITEAALGLGHALHGAAGLLLMSDGGDLGRAAGDARSDWFAVGNRSSKNSYSVPDQGQDLDGSCAPTLFFFDKYPGGTGLAERLFEEREELMCRTRRILERCPCLDGCPACVGPGSRAETKQLAIKLLLILTRGLQATGASEVKPPIATPLSIEPPSEIQP